MFMLKRKIEKKVILIPPFFLNHIGLLGFIRSGNHDEIWNVLVSLCICFWWPLQEPPLNVWL